MAKHNPKLNPCCPWRDSIMNTHLSLELKREAAEQLLDLGWHKRRVRKTLELSGRQLRKAINQTKRPANV